MFFVGVVNCVTVSRAAAFFGSERDRKFCRLKLSSKLMIQHYLKKYNFEFYLVAFTWLKFILSIKVYVFDSSRDLWATEKKELLWIKAKK